MKNRNGFMYLFLTIVILAVTTINLNVFGEKMSDGVSSDLVEVGIYSELRDVFPKDIFDEVFTKKDIEFLLDKPNVKIEYLKDSVEIVIKEKAKPSSVEDSILYADNQPVKINKKGNILVPRNTKIISKMQLDKQDSNYSNSDGIGLDSKHKFNMSTFTNKGNSLTRTPEVIFTVSSGELLTVMDEKEAKYRSDNNMTPMNYGKKYKTGDWVHCNRFNGPFTDHVHYNYRTGSAAEKAKAAKNGYFSDCYSSLFFRLAGCTSLGSCVCNNPTPGYCSTFLKDAATGKKCPTTYHANHSSRGAVPR